MLLVYLTFWSSIELEIAFGLRGHCIRWTSLLSGIFFTKGGSFDCWQHGSLNLYLMTNIYQVIPWLCLVMQRVDWGSISSKGELKWSFLKISAWLRVQLTQAWPRTTDTTKEYINKFDYLSLCGRQNMLWPQYVGQ